MKKKILLITTGLPASDRRGWSGIPYSLKKELAKYYDVDEYCLNKRRSIVALARTFYLSKIKKQFVSITLLKNYAKRESRKLDTYLKNNKYDFLFVTHPSGAGAFAFTTTTIPIIFYSDCVLSMQADDGHLKTSYSILIGMIFRSIINGAQKGNLRKIY